MGNRRSRMAASAVGLGLLMLATTPQSSKAQLYGENPKRLSDGCWTDVGLVFETGSRDMVLDEAYKFILASESLKIHPYWPASKSGVTIGIGWDIGAHSRNELNVWNALGPATLARLGTVSGIIGTRARDKLSTVSDIVIPKEVSISVAKETIGKELHDAEKLFPGTKKLPVEAQVALISLVFNRGIARGHEPDWNKAQEVDSRFEMRHMQDSVENADFFGIYVRLNSMERLWGQPGTNTRGLLVRRRAEMRMIYHLVYQQMQWDEDRLEVMNVMPKCR